MTFLFAKSSSKNDCCGCSACADICPNEAIKFVIDFQGFCYPEIDAEKCVKCGMCAKVCPLK